MSCSKVLQTSIQASVSKELHHCKVCPSCATFCTPAMPSTQLQLMSLINMHKLASIMFPTPPSVLTESKASTQIAGPVLQKKAISLQMRNGIDLDPSYYNFLFGYILCKSKKMPTILCLPQKASCKYTSLGHTTELGANVSICQLMDASLVVPARTQTKAAPELKPCTLYSLH